MTERAIVFVGPSLKPQDLAHYGDRFSWWPPAKQGDVYRALAVAPAAIGIIDGFFSGAPSVWHKEILFALDQGVPVYGSASMGALRAAELADFGMRGIGQIFAHYRAGLCEDDDEVALTHAPAELGWQALSVPMVNVRASLALALADGLVTADEHDRLLAIAKSQFFARRTWDSILAAMDEAQRLSPLRAWLAAHSVDQKRLDALAMLDAMQSNEIIPGKDFRFEWTHHFASLAERIDREVLQTAAQSASPARALVEELRLQGLAAYQAVRDRALSRHLAGGWGQATGSTEVSRQAKLQVLQELRKRLGLVSQKMLTQWALENELDEKALDRLLSSEARRKEALRLAPRILDALLLDELKLSGQYARLCAQAKAKRENLSNLSKADNLKSMNPSPPFLRQWYFTHHMGQEQPESIDAYRQALDFADLAEFDGALRREWLNSLRSVGHKNQ